MALSITLHAALNFFSHGRIHIYTSDITMDRKGVSVMQSHGLEAVRRWLPCADELRTMHLELPAPTM